MLNQRAPGPNEPHSPQKRLTNSAVDALLDCQCGALAIPTRLDLKGHFNSFHSGLAARSPPRLGCYRSISMARIIHRTFSLAGIYLLDPPITSLRLALSIELSANKIAILTPIQTQFLYQTSSGRTSSVSP
jgi:hypothetical protein